MRAAAWGWRPIACIAPWPIRPRPMPEPIAATPMPMGRPSESAACRSMNQPPGLVGVLRTRLVPVLVVTLVRQHEEDVDRGQNREHHGLQRAAEEREREEQGVQRDAERDRLPRQHRDAERGERDEEHVDRKSTRLNSSHGYISYAVFCLK